MQPHSINILGLVVMSPIEGGDKTSFVYRGKELNHYILVFLDNFQGSNNQLTDLMQGGKGEGGLKPQSNCSASIFPVKNTSWHEVNVIVGILKNIRIKKTDKFNQLIVKACT